MNALLRPVLAGTAGLALLLGAACSSTSDNGGPPARENTAAATPTAVAETQTPPPAGSRMTAEELVKYAEPSVVRVATESGVGSGFVIDEDGYIVTNNHVVAGASQVIVTLSDGAEEPASIVGLDPKGDLALLRIERSGLPALPLADLDTVAIGQDVLAIGYALDLRQGEGPSFSVTRGIVSQKNRPISEASPILGAVQTDAAINHGNSGGPLLNFFGEVVGVNTALQPDTATGGVAQGIGYAVGSDTVRAVVKKLREDGSVRRGLLGVRGFEAIRPADVKELGLPEGTRGIYLPRDPIRVQFNTAPSVDPNGPAARAGIQPGDVIVSIAGEPIVNEGDLAIAMIEHGPGEVVSVELYRGGERLTVEVTLGENE